MKKFLSLTLVLILTCTLWLPALAAEDPAGMKPDDPYEAYQAAHPEEIAALDLDTLLAGWGYKAPVDAFLDDYDWLGEDAQTVAVEKYVTNRLNAEANAQYAAKFRAQDPLSWAAFDADTYFDGDVKNDWVDWHASKEAYMAYHNLLTQEEFADDMFQRCMDYYGTYDPLMWMEEEPAQPTLTLVVNGVAADTVLTAENGVTYADADALRAILGADAVPEDTAGPVAVRAAAQAAGWDVVWYDGGWRGINQQVCLWDKEGILADLTAEFQPFKDFYAAALAESLARLNQEGGYQAEQTGKITITKFNTLDGDKTFDLTFAAKTVCKDGYVDATLSFDVAQLLNLVDLSALAGKVDLGRFNLDTLKNLLQAGSVEVRMDLNSLDYAIKAPILNLLAPDTFTGEWYRVKMDGETLDAFLAQSGLERADLFSLDAVTARMVQMLDFGPMFYDETLRNSEYIGGEVAGANLTKETELLKGMLGKDRFTHEGDTWTYRLTTEGMNALGNTLLNAAIGRKDFDIDLFAVCDLTLTLDGEGNQTLSAEVRPDLTGLADLALVEDSAEGAPVWLVLREVLSALDFRMTAQSTATRTQASETTSFHIKNLFKVDLTSEATMTTAQSEPRTPAELEPSKVQTQELDGSMFGIDVGIIGGADGPTAIWVTEV